MRYEEALFEERELFILIESRIVSSSDLPLDAGYIAVLCPHSPIARHSRHNTHSSKILRSIAVFYFRTSLAYLSSGDALDDLHYPLRAEHWYRLHKKMYMIFIDPCF